MARDVFRVHPTAFEVEEAEQSTRSTFRDRTRTCCLALRGRARKRLLDLKLERATDD